MIAEKLQKLKGELKLYEAIYEDFVTRKIPVINVRTDAVYWVFCGRHPDVKVNQKTFTRILCEELNLKSVQSWVEGERGSFYVSR